MGIFQQYDNWVCLKMGYTVNTFEMDVSIGKTMINQWMEWNIPFSDRPQLRYVETISLQSLI